MNDIPDHELLTAKLALVSPDRGAQRWLAALAAIVAAQHEEQPEGLELNVNGIVINVTYDRFEPGDDEDTEQDLDDLED
jgi:hypothetical protein